MREVRPPSVPARRDPTPASSPVAAALLPQASSRATVSDGLAPRLQERRQAARRRRRRKALGVLATVAVLTLTAWAVSTAHVFALDMEAVAVEGDGTWVSEQQVVDAVQQFEGASWWTVRTDDVADAVLTIGAVREVVVEKVWPRGLAIEIVERTPVAVVPTATGEVVVVDDAGVVLPIEPTAVEGLPVIDVPVGGDHVRVQQAALAVLYELPHEVRAQVTSVSASTEDSVTMTLDSGLRVEWGSAEQAALKVEVLMVLLDSEAIVGVDVVDVSAPTLPVTRTED